MCQVRQAQGVMLAQKELRGGFLEDLSLRRVMESNSHGAVDKIALGGASNPG